MNKKLIDRQYKSIACFITGHNFIEINRHCSYNKVRSWLLCTKCASSYIDEMPRMRQGDNKPIQREGRRR